MLTVNISECLVQIYIGIQSVKHYQHNDNNYIEEVHQTAFESGNHMGFTIKTTVCWKEIKQHPKNTNHFDDKMHPA